MINSFQGLLFHCSNLKVFFFEKCVISMMAYNCITVQSTQKGLVREVLSS